MADNEKRYMTATFRVVINGFAADMAFDGTLNEFVALTDAMNENESIRPGNSPLLWEGQGRGGNGSQPATTQAAQPAQQQANTGTVPTCDWHGTPLEVSKYGGWFCTQKTDNPQWSNSRGYCKFTYKD